MGVLGVLGEESMLLGCVDRVWLVNRVCWYNAEWANG